jgi:putative phosphoesterase
VSGLSKKVTRIAVLSDTHFHNFDEMPSSLLEKLKTFDLVIHLGDFVNKDLVEYFRGFNNFYGIAGNHDPQSVKKILPKTDVIQVNGKRLGLLHGYWFPFFCQHRSLARFKNDNVDAILYGHTHVIRNEITDNILFFNPGSASALWPAPWKTYGVLNVGESITGEIISIPGEGIRGFSKLTDAVIKRSQVLRWICRADRNPDSSVDSISKNNLLS